MWGTSSEVIKLSTPKRSVNNYADARQILSTFAGMELKNKNGLTGRISRKSIEKFLSGKAVETSFDLKAHFLVLANIDTLFQNAIEPFETEPDKHGSPDVKAIHRTYAPLLIEMNGEKRIIPIKFSVKEYADKNQKNKLLQY